MSNAKAEYKIFDGKRFLKIDGKYVEVELKDCGEYLRVEVKKSEKIKRANFNF